MTEEFCERVRMSAMAARDGEAGPLSTEQVAEHVRQCPHCRREIAELAGLADRLDRQRRRAVEADLRPRIAAALARAPTGGTAAERIAFPLLGAALAACKLADYVPGLDLSPVVKLAPVLLVGAAFCWLRANPFAINPELKPEGV
jgi:predicted anti-sigma-YlaC factor YlaD